MTLDENLTYAGSFSEAQATRSSCREAISFERRADTFAGGTVDGSNILYTEGTTTVSGLTIGGTVEWVNTKFVTQNGGTVTIGDASGDKAILNNSSTGTYDIADNSGIDRGSSTASHIFNAGLFEKTSGKGGSMIVPNVTNNGTIEVTSGTLAFKGRILGTGSDTISGASTLRLMRRSGWPNGSVHGQRRRTRTARPSGVPGSIRGLDTAGAGSNAHRGRCAVGLHRLHREAGGTGTLGFKNGASTFSLMLIGDYTSADFHAHTQANGSTVIT